ncbi:hypothetical protein PM082_015367 [Marasmius tenuissimus]|nr:hypothetical protein PM082_015367 [Marasmius tenuissimus]
MKTTGLFFILSGLLAEITQNQTYLDAASQSLDFIYNHLYNDQNIVEDTIFSDTCKTTSFILPYNSAYMIEGMSILSSITKNQSTLQLLRDTLAATVYNKAWQGDDGIISYGSGHSGDRDMVHALSTVYQRGSTAPDLRNYIRDYLTVQYNALSDLATNSSGIYGSSWVGPPETQLNAGAQLTALTLLTGAILLRNDTDDTNTRPAGPESTQPRGTLPNSDSGSTDIAAIIGGSIGGTLFLFLMCSGIGIWWLRRCRRQQKAVDTLGAHKGHQPSANGTTLDYLVIAPFTEQSKNRSEHVESLEVQTGGVHQDLKQKNTHTIAPICGLGPPPSHRSNTTSGTDYQGTESTMNELVADVRTLRLQHSYLQKRIWEEDKSPPPGYYPVRSE